MPKRKPPKIQKLSPPFGPKLKPWEPGVYRTWPKNAPATTAFQYWDGKCWNGWGCDIRQAMENKGFRSRSQNHRWQGLATDPKAK